MNTPTVVLELSNSAIKIVVGYVSENKPVILYAASFANQGLIENGEVVDVKGLATLLKNHVNVNDEAARTNFTITRAVLIIPPTGLMVYEDKRRTAITSSQKQISRVDITNVTNMFCNSQQDPSSYLLDITPLLYYVGSESNKTADSPIGYISTTLAMKALIYTLPRRFVESYQMALEMAGIRLQKIVIAPTAAASYLNIQKDTPQIYLYIDMGSELTSVSLVSKKRVYSSTTFQMGGDLLTQDIANAFGIETSEAEKLKRHYGYSARKISFNPVITEHKNDEGESEHHTLADLNEITKIYLDKFIATINESIDHLLASYPEDKRHYPIIVGGAASRLAGFLDLFKARRPNDDIKAVPLNVIGVRHQKYLNGVGGLLAEENNPDVVQYNLAKNAGFSRTSALDKKMRS